MQGILSCTQKCDIHNFGLSCDLPSQYPLDQNGTGKGAAYKTKGKTYKFVIYMFTCEKVEYKQWIIRKWNKQKRKNKWTIRHLRTYGSRSKR